MNAGLGRRFPLVTLLVSNPDSVDHFFAGTNDGIYHTSNRGLEWAPVGFYASALAFTRDPEINLLAGESVSVYAKLWRFRTSSGAWEWVWTPLGGAVQALALKDSFLFAGTNNGVFLSTNWKDQPEFTYDWTEIDSGLTNPNVRTLVVEGDSLLAGTFGGGISLSTNNGALWMPINAGLADLNVRALTVFNGGASGRMIAAGTETGVFVSSDNGRTWEFSGLAGRRVYALVVAEN